MSSHIGTTVHRTKTIEFDRMDVNTFQSYKVKATDKHGGVVELSLFVQNEDVEEFEKGWNDPQPEPLVTEDIEAVVNALRVFMLDSTVREVLKRIDPKGFEQAREALKGIGRNI